MAQKNLSFDDVAKAAKSIEKQGQEPNTKNIREYLGRGSLSTISKFLQKWRNEKEQEKRIEEIDLKEVLGKMNTDLIVDFFSNEHPQVIALALSHLESEQVANILKKFPQSNSQNILARMENLGPVQKSIIDKMASVIKEEIASILNQYHIHKGGKDFVSEVKKQMQGKVT